jgi:hypothetical protein
VEATFRKCRACTTAFTDRQSLRRILIDPRVQRGSISRSSHIGRRKAVEMVIHTAVALVSVVAIGVLTDVVEARNWLAPVPETQRPIGGDAVTFRDTSVVYGSRARVRIYRPDGVFDLNSDFTSDRVMEPGDADTDTTDR